MSRRLQLLGCLFAFAIAGCQNLATISVACTNSTQCQSNNFCGADHFCHLAATCTLPEHACGSDCVSFDSSANCGGCGIVCDPGAACDALTTPGAPACKTYCTPGVLDDCSGTCRDLKSDAANCGACGKSCPAGEACVAGACEILCPSGEALCGASCVDKLSDLAHCGDCANACPRGNYCVAGACTTDCGAPLSVCSTACVNEQSDVKNCGSCGKVCRVGESCAGGLCQLLCASGTQACPVNGASACVDVGADQLNCGSCGNSCAAGESCQSGICRTNCPASQSACDGVCVDVSSDSDHCGSCSLACAAGERCTGGQCAPSCQDALSACPALLADGGTASSCTDTQRDPGNCGACGKSCPALEACVGGACVLSCPDGLAACGGTCVSTSVDGNNCGGCGGIDGGAGHSCGAGASCSAGHCVASCPSGSLLCVVSTDGGVALDAGVSTDGGVETCVDPSSDNRNCGGCGLLCPSGQVCSAGHCGATCGANAQLCGSACANTQIDAKNCGGCGVAIADAGTETTHLCLDAQVCQSGSCKSSCGSGLSSCNGLCFDLNNDPKNCGTCGHGCDSGQTCSLGSCQPGCPAVCGGACTNLSIDPNNCGSCGGACGPYTNGTAVCANKTCAALCATGFADCNQTLSDGCETDLTSSATNCGACGNACAAPDNASSSCSTSKCSWSCASGFGNCDGDGANGCEASEATDAQNCGSCGNSCAAHGLAFCASTGNAGPACISAASGVPSGVLQNVALADLSTAGFSVCFVDAYNDSNAGTIATSVLSNCSGTRLILGCRLASSPRLLLAAAADRAGATMATSGNQTTSANGVRWYSTNRAWGFAPAGAQIDLTSSSGSCDIGGATDSNATGFGSQRLCWLTSGGDLGAGARCGDKQSLGGSTTYERIILSAP